MEKSNKTVPDTTEEAKEVCFRFFRDLKKGNSVCLAILPVPDICLYPTVYKIKRIRRNGTLVLQPNKSLED